MEKILLLDYDSMKVLFDYDVTVITTFLSFSLFLEALTSLRKAFEKIAELILGNIGQDVCVLNDNFFLLPIPLAITKNAVYNLMFCD